MIVADPNLAPMYATRSRRVKTERRDARTLADAGRLGAYRATHRTSAAQRTVRAQLAVRETWNSFPSPFAKRAFMAPMSRRER